MFAIEELDLKSALCVTLLVVIIQWTVGKHVLRWLGIIQPKSQSRPQEPLIDEDDYPDLHIPPYPHMEVVFDPPTCLQVSNTSESYPYENEYVYGKMIVFHPPTKGDPGDCWCADYFKGKKRRWELRLQLQFKRPPAADTEMYFGVELDEYVPMNAAVKRLQSVAVAAAQTALGSVYQSCGDDPSNTTGELERPSIVLPLWAFDQFIVTPEGQEPPKLTDPNFPQMGQKRYKRIKDFCQELDEVRRNFDTVSTYTFSTWGVSRFLDVMDWQMLGIPMVTPLEFNKFCGRPPVGCVLYSMSPSANDKDGRHLQSRKHYYFRANVWSSTRRPEKRRFEHLTGLSEPLIEGAHPAKAKKSLLRRTKGFMMSTFTCCTSRPQG